MPALAIAWGDMAPWLADWSQVVEASGPAGLAAGRDLRALVVEFMDGGSCAAAVGAVPIRLHVQPERASRRRCRSSP